MIKSNIPSGNSSGIRVDGYNDMVQVYDPYKKSWVDYQNTGVIVLPSTIIITTTTLNGQPVTCVIGDYSETTVFVDGVATFKNIFVTGTATVTSSEFSVEVEVSESGQTYEGVLEEIVEILLWDYETSSPYNGATIDTTNRHYLHYNFEKTSLCGKKLFLKARATSGSVRLVVRFQTESDAQRLTLTNKNVWETENPSKLYTYTTDITYSGDFDSAFSLMGSGWANGAINFEIYYIYGTATSRPMLNNFSRIWLE